MIGQTRSKDLWGLKALVGILGVLIVLGTALVIGVVIQRIYAKPAAASISEAPWTPPKTDPLMLPPGSRISGIAAAGGDLAVWVTGPAADQIWLVDPRTGARFVTMTASK